MFGTTLERLLAGPMLDGDGTNGGGGNGDENENDGTNKDGTEGTTKPKFEWTPEQQAEINRIAAESRRDGETKGRTAAETAQQEAEVAAQAQREQEEQEAKGEFAKVKQTFETKLGEKDGEIERLTGDNETLRTFFDARFEADVEDLPEVIRVFDPGKDAPLKDRVDWFEKAREQAKKMVPENRRSAGSRPNRGHKPSNPSGDDVFNDVKKSAAGRVF